MDNKTTLLQVEQLSIFFEDFCAVEELSFQLNRKKTLAVVGESGSGKSLTALSLIGLLPQSSRQEGKIIWHPENKTLQLTHLSQKHWQTIRGNDMGLIFQEPMSALNPIIKVGAQLKECLSIHQPKLSQKEKHEKMVHWFAKVQLPSPETIGNRYPHELSGGQKQRVIIAMAMCNHPDLLIADEPTTALDVTVQKEVIGLMKHLQKETGTALLFITHDLKLAAEIADEVLVMKGGKKVETGEAKEILIRPNQAYTKALLECKPSIEKKNKPLSVVDEKETNDAENVWWKNEKRLGETLLSVKNLDVRYATKRNWRGQNTAYHPAVRNVSFSIQSGEILGLVGESGCGKSTIGKALVGLVPIHSGTISWKDGQTLNNRKTRAQNIQMIFQDPMSALNPSICIGEAIAEPMRLHRKLNRSQARNEVMKLLDITGLPRMVYHRYPHQFSGGQKQRIGIARALAVQPQLLIADESVSALDVSIQAQILNLLNQLRYEMNLSFLFISHDLNVVHYFSDRVMVMKHGEIIEENEATELFTNPQQPYTQTLLSAAQFD